MCGTSLLFYEWKWATQLNSVLLTNGDRLDVLAAAKDFTFSFLLRTMVPISVIIMNKGSSARGFGSKKVEYYLQGLYAWFTFPCRSELHFAVEGSP